jgi:hypothetical protein
MGFCVVVNLSSLSKNKRNFSLIFKMPFKNQTFLHLFYGIAIENKYDGMGLLIEGYR